MSVNADDLSAESILLRDDRGGMTLKIATKSAMAIKLGKEMFYRQLPMDLTEAYVYASERMVCNMDSHDAREGIDAFIQKRKPEWKHQ